MKPMKTFYTNRSDKLSFKNVPNIRLKGNTFDASHLDAFIVDDNVSILVRLLIIIDSLWGFA